METKDAAKCRYCGKHYPHAGGREKCPAYGKECHNCGKNNHFASVCLKSKNDSKSSPKQQNKKWNRTKQKKSHVYQIGETSDNEVDDEYVYTLSNKNKQLPVFSVKVNGQPMMMMADSGATVNIMDLNDFNNLTVKPKLKQTNTRIMPYDRVKSLKVYGTFTATVESHSCLTTANSWLYLPLT